MKDYSKFEVADFLLDDSFIQWAQGISDRNAIFWLSFVKKYPEKEDIFYQAKNLASSVEIKPYRDISDDEVANLVQLIAEKTYLLQSEDEQIDEATPLFRKQWLRIAATLIMISALGLLFYRSYFPSKQEALQISTITQTNRKSKPVLIRLPDNTSVVLKPGSKISYNSTFNNVKREVCLNGEAFFEVSKNKQKPFIVYSDELVTKVLGTSFLIKALKGSEKYSVTVNTGRVSVFHKSYANTKIIEAKTVNDLEGKGVLVKPNEEVDFYRNDDRLIKKNLEQPSILSEEVTRTSLNFVDTPFSEVVKALKKSYDIQISYDKKRMASCPLTASLTHQSLYEKLRLICNAVEADYKIVEGEIVIEGKGCLNQ